MYIFFMKTILFSFCLSSVLFLSGCGNSEDAGNSSSNETSSASSSGGPAGKLAVAHWVKGDPVDISKGVHVVEFWATWCPPCRTSIPHLTETQAKFKDRGVNIVGVTNEDLDTVEPFVKKMGKKMDYTVVIDDNRELSNKYMKKYGVNGIPHAFVIKDGEVVWHDHPMRDLDGAIEDALK